jgi:anti-sigma-K factor RskA
MSRDTDRPDEFEQHTRRVLGESVTRVNRRVRSRLNEARQAALAEIEVRPRSFWRLPAIVPAASAAAVAGVVAVILMTQQGGGLPTSEGGQAFEVIELLSDNDGLDLIENYDGSFYEWAAAEGEEGANGASG